MLFVETRQEDSTAHHAAQQGFDSNSLDTFDFNSLDTFDSNSLDTCGVFTARELRKERLSKPTPK